MNNQLRATFDALGLSLTPEDQAVMDSFWANDPTPEAQAIIAAFCEYINQVQISTREAMKECDRLQKEIDRKEKQNSLSAKRIGDGANKAIAKLGPDGRRRARRRRAVPRTT